MKRVQCLPGILEAAGSNVISFLSFAFCLCKKPTLKTASYDDARIEYALERIKKARFPGIPPAPFGAIATCSVQHWTGCGSGMEAAGLTGVEQNGVGDSTVKLDI
jgi:hypothetical protein